MIQDIRTINKKGSKFNTIQVQENNVWRDMEHVTENEIKNVNKHSLLISKIIKKLTSITLEMTWFLILFVGGSLLIKFICTLF